MAIPTIERHQRVQPIFDANHPASLELIKDVRQKLNRAKKDFDNSYWQQREQWSCAEAVAISLELEPKEFLQPITNPNGIVFHQVPDWFYKLPYKSTPNQLKDFKKRHDNLLLALGTTSFKAPYMGMENDKFNHSFDEIHNKNKFLSWWTPPIKLTNPVPINLSLPSF